MMKNALGYDLGKNCICTLQMCVSAYGPDEYDPSRLNSLKTMEPVFQKASYLFASYQLGDSLTAAQEEILSKVIAKESRAAHSWNGLCNKMAWGYGLKQAVKNFFGVQMTTFEDVVGKGTMADVSGHEVASYGAEDSYWAMKLFHYLLVFMTKRDPRIISTCFDQEVPMSFVFVRCVVSGI